MTTPYSPSTATALAVGATWDGAVIDTGVPWDADLSRYNLRAIGQRAAKLAVQAREDAVDLRRRLRLATGVQAAPCRILAVGDSITVGSGSADGTGYRGWLAAALDRRDVAAHTAMCAQGGGTLRTVAPLVPAALEAHQPDVVLIHIGTNDAAQPDLTSWQSRHGALLDQILAWSPTVRVACALIQRSYPAWSASQVAINGWITSNVAARQATGRVAVADMTSWGQEHTSDGVHPLEAGYVHMARVWAEAIAGWVA